MARSRNVANDLFFFFFLHVIFLALSRYFIGQFKTRRQKSSSNQKFFGNLKTENRGKKTKMPKKSVLVEGQIQEKVVFFWLADFFVSYSAPERLCGIRIELFSLSRPRCCDGIVCPLVLPLLLSIAHKS